MTIASDDLASDDVSSRALLQTHFFRCTSSDAFLQMHSSRRFKLRIKFLCSWTCSIRIFMNSTLIMNPVHLNKLFSKSNWWFLIPCYYQNLRGDLEKHPLFQQNILFYINILFLTIKSVWPTWNFYSHGYLVGVTHYTRIFINMPNVPRLLSCLESSV